MNDAVILHIRTCTDRYAACSGTHGCVEPDTAVFCDRNVPIYVCTGRNKRRRVNVRIFPHLICPFLKQCALFIIACAHCSIKSPDFGLFFFISVKKLKKFYELRVVNSFFSRYTFRDIVFADCEGTEARSNPISTLRIQKVQREQYEYFKRRTSVSRLWRQSHFP